MTRRILSIAIAVIATVLGYLALWSGGVILAQSAMVMRPIADVGPVALALLGVVLLGIAAFSVVFSSAGVIGVGGFHVVFGMLALAFPIAGITKGFAPAYEAIRLLGGLGREISNGPYYTVTTGFGMLTGAILLAIGFAARARRSPAATAISANRIVAILAAVLVGVPGLLLVIAGGGMSFRSTVVTLRAAPPLAIIALVAGVLLVAAVVVLARWSSAGVIVLGVIVSVFGAIALFSLGAIGLQTLRFSQELGFGIQSIGGTGNILAVGLTLIGAGLGARLRAPRSSV